MTLVFLAQLTPNAPVMLYNNFSSNKTDEQMTKKHIVAGLISLAVILGWNVFLVQRDEKLYDNYYRSKAIDNLQKPHSTEIR